MSERASENIYHLPLVEREIYDGLISEKEALKIWSELRVLPGDTRRRIQTQVETVQFEVEDKLTFDVSTGVYHLDTSELRTILTKMAIRAVAQEAEDVGHVLAQIHQIRQDFAEPIIAYGDEGQPPSGEPPNDQS